MGYRRMMMLSKTQIDRLGGTQERMAAVIKADLEKWAKVVKESGARAE